MITWVVTRLKWSNLLKYWSEIMSQPPCYLILYLIMLMLTLNCSQAEINQPPGGQLPATIKKNYNWGDKPHHISAEVCKECHQEIYQQWQQSMHAQSTALADPIHEAFYRNEVGDPRKAGATFKNGQYPVCLKCHAPNAALDKNTQLDALPVYNEGISCINCHLLKEFKGTKREDGKLNSGLEAYEIGTVLQGPSGKTFTTQLPDSTLAATDAKPAYHPYPMVSNTTLLRTTEICLGCHGQRNNPQGVSVCVTGDEFAKSNYFNCQQCHMPINNGYANHAFAGGHVQAMLERAVILTLATTKQDNNIQAEVTLINTLPHNTPTGAPFRNMYVQVTAYNEQDQPVWQNFQTHPLQEDPNAMLMKTFLDKQGKPAMPPNATQLGQDTTLQPNETRVLKYTIPAEAVVRVRAQLFYDLLWPNLKQKFTDIPAELKQSKAIARAEQRL